MENRAHFGIDTLNDKKPVPAQDKPAGPFSSWLKRTIAVIHNRDDAQVPCAECAACCNSAYFVHIKPSDTDTIAHVPKALTFAAPGLPAGHLLMGYDENGRCPMYVDSMCSIYEFRPQTCRQYDCRVFAATGIDVEDRDDGQSGSQKRTLIARQARRWAFDVAGEQDHNEFKAVQAAARFLSEHADVFPRGFVPANATQQAILAIEIYTLFLAPQNMTAEERVNAIVRMRARAAEPVNDR